MTEIPIIQPFEPKLFQVFMPVIDRKLLGGVSNNHLLREGFGLAPGQIWLQMKTEKACIWKFTFNMLAHAKVANAE